MEIAEDFVVPTDQFILVTVGSTKFEELLKQLDVNAEVFMEYMIQNGYTTLVLQIGTSAYIPSELPNIAKKFPQVRIVAFRFSHDFGKLLQKASLVISHAGAGSILETLRVQPTPPRLLVVVNEQLMDNHQLELAEELARGSFLFYCCAKTLVATLKGANWSSIRPYVAINKRAFAALVSQELDLAK